MSYIEKIQKTAGSISEILSKITLVIGGILVAVMSGVVIIGVFFRYVLVHPIQWIEEVSVYGMIWMSLLCASVVYRKKNHPRINFIYDSLPFPIQIVLHYIGEVLISIFLIIATIKGFDYAFNTGLRRQCNSLPISMMIPYLSISFGCLSILLQQILITIASPLALKESIIEDMEIKS